MKHINFFRLPVFMLISISISTTAVAQSTSGTYNVATAGTLATLVGSTNKSTLTSIVLTGSLNGNDIKFIREMANLNLASINMSGAAIVAGGGRYYANFATDANVIGDYMFRRLE